MKVKADVLLSSFSKVCRFSGMLNESFQLSAELFALFNAVNPAVDVPGLFIIFLEGFLQVDSCQCVQMMTVTQAKEFLFFNNISYIPHLKPVATDLLLTVGKNKARMLHETCPRWALVTAPLGPDTSLRFL